MSEEYSFLEQQQKKDPAATMRVFAAIQLQRAEACKRLWERVGAVVEQARSQTYTGVGNEQNSANSDGRT